jgi:hypothetical protein
MRALSSFVILTVFATASAATAAKKTTYAPLPEPLPGSFMSEAQYQAAQKEAKADTKTRQIAEADKVNDAYALSDEMKNLRSQIIGGSHWKNNEVEKGGELAGIQKAEDLTRLIADLDKNYSKLTQTDAKFVAAQLIALKPFRSIIYRCRRLIDSAKISKSVIITMIRGAAVGTDIFFPTEQWQAGFSYLTEPSANMGADINTEIDFHNYMTKELYPSLYTLIERVNGMKFSKPVYFDNKMLYSQANFVSDDDRYAILTETERQLYLSGLLFNMSGLMSASSYSWEGLFQAADSIARIYGFDSISFDIEGATAKDRFTRVKRYPQLFTLRQGGAGWMKSSYKWFIEGVRTAKLAWLRLKDDQNNNRGVNNLIDPRGLMPFVRQIDESVNNIENLIQDKEVVSAVVNGEAVDVRFSQFFLNPPKDLKAFMPTEFNKESNYKKNAYGTYRNYRAGSPVGWNLEAYRRYFPDVKSNEDIKRAARILGQSWGGALVGAPLTSFIM